MRIVYDYQIFSGQVYGGISRYFVELARRLSGREDVRAKIMAPLYINSYAHELNSGIVTGLHVTRIPKTGRLFAAFNRIASRQWLGRFAPHIVHETYYSDKPLSTYKRAKTVITVHDMIHERFSEHFSDKDTTALTKRLAVERADHVICISETTRQDLLEITNINPAKVSVVYHGFDLTVKPTEFDGNAIDEPYILYVGARGGYKNFARLFRAYGNTPALHKQCKLVCFGGGQFTRAEQQLRQELGLAADRLLWVGGNDRILSRLYRHATAFVYPSLYEGFGIPPLEAMSYGCPVVCSNGGSIPEVVGDAGEFFDPHDEGAIAQAIEQVVFSRERADALRALGEKRITRFSWDACAEQTYRIYKSL